MDLSPSALLEASAPYLLAVAAVALALVAAFAVAVFAKPARPPSSTSPSGAGGAAETPLTAPSRTV
ncbi:hypothetical protein [Streptomyces sp. H34-S4]|uniref:hypothetical protein n=1 Tax=Streptomyces sp. H34-S4 TaxID=2996463 RepID=UPI00226D9106|nr:hypothetical protein [Streptomyces sp. H34-S4]MCY0935420.1 hypothetical protein [Streptomyces sp. H34-S4]